MNGNKKVLVGWSESGPVYRDGKEVTPSYSRSGGKVFEIDGKFFVPHIDEQYPARFFDTSEAAWGYCEAAYYSYN